MLSVERKALLFRTKDIYFAERPFDVAGCDAVSFIDCTHKIDVEGFTCIEKATLITDLTKDIDTIFGNISSNSRYKIRRAERDGMKISLNRHYDEFYHLNKKFEQKMGFSSTLYGWTQNAEFMRKYSTLFSFEYEGEILGGHLFLEDENHIRTWYSASKRLEVDKRKTRLISRANRLLYWEAMKYAKEKGLSEFDWGGMWSDDEANQDEHLKAINDFKASFGGEPVTRYEYKKAYSKAYMFAQYIYKLASRKTRKHNGL